MVTIRRAGERGHTALGWLDSFHTFSFGEYRDPRYSGFRSLRVLNDDRIAPGKGFGAHGHRDMEILSYVLSGALAHRDSTGDGHVLGPNDVQLMTAGTGVIHSEFNASDSDEVHFLQIWVDPAVTDLPPAYHQVTCARSEKRGTLRLIAGPQDAAGGRTLALHQDARIYAAVLDAAQGLSYEVPSEHSAWLHCATGQLAVNDVCLAAGDGLAVIGESPLVLRGAGTSASELLLFESGLSAVNVLVVFYSNGGDTERLALTVGVGAIQAHASIRLRRLTPGPEVQTHDMTAGRRGNFERMSRDYTTPRQADADWADAFILATSREGRSHLESVPWKGSPPFPSGTDSLRL